MNPGSTVDLKVDGHGLKMCVGADVYVDAPRGHGLKMFVGVDVYVDAPRRHPCSTGYQYRVTTTRDPAATCETPIGTAT